MNEEKINIHQLGLKGFEPIYQAMKQFTEARSPETEDEIWLLEHPPIFTQGQNGKPEHVLRTSHIPIVQADRGGQITYHGPGQLMIYTLIDVKRKKFTIRDFVCRLERAIIDCLSEFNVEAEAKREAPGVYIQNQKVSSLGLRIRRGYAYHGLALNIEMDLSPFNFIHPCGLQNIQMTQLSEHAPGVNIINIIPKLIDNLCKQLGYTSPKIFVENLNG